MRERIRSAAVNCFEARTKLEKIRFEPRTNHGENSQQVATSPQRSEAQTHSKNRQPLAAPVLPRVPSMLTFVDISAYIKTRLDEINREQIASTDEVMRFFTSVLRGTEKDQFGLDASLADRIKAGQEIVKRFDSIKQPEQDDTNARMSTLASLLNAPQPNRNINDFEDEDGGANG